jgi:hypothetical protein
MLSIEVPMSDRVGRLRSLRDRLEQLPAEDRGHIRAWVAEATPVVRRDWPDYLDEFRAATAEPSWVSYPAVAGTPEAEVVDARIRADEQAANRWVAEDAKRRILATLAGILSTADGVGDRAAIETVEFLCRRFPLFARQMGTRQRGRPPVAVDDEYDLQYLMLALLRLHFDDVRPESWTPPYAGGSSRMDFLLKAERIVLETKMTRDGLRDREVADQLIVDVERYSASPDCDTIACFVYDPARLLDNPTGLARDLSGPRGRVCISVFMA